MRDVYEPMDVRIVDNDHGSHVEPALEQRWSQLDKLRWKAGTVKAATGVVVTMMPGAMSTPTLFGGYRIHWDRFSLGIGNSGYSAFRFDEAWDFLNGVEAGASANSETFIPGEWEPRIADRLARMAAGYFG